MSVLGNVVDSIQSPPTTHQPIPEAVLKANALLAYKAGNSWLTYGPYSEARPDLAAKGWIVSVTLTCLARARMYDIEPGGGTNQNIGVFMKNADRTRGLPILYTFASNGAAMLAAAKKFGYRQGKDFYYLAAHIGRGVHVCSPQTCGFPRSDGTQYEFAGAVDFSVFEDYVLPKRVKSRPKPKPPAPVSLPPNPYPHIPSRLQPLRRKAYNRGWEDGDTWRGHRGSL